MAGPLKYGLSRIFGYGFFFLTKSRRRIDQPGVFLDSSFGRVFCCLARH